MITIIKESTESQFTDYYLTRPVKNSFKDWAERVNLLKSYDKKTGERYRQTKYH
jgi:hypothetical protein